MNGIVFLRDSVILISSLIVKLLRIVFTVVRQIVKKFSKLMLMVCVLSILLVNTGQGGMTSYRLKMVAAGMIFILLSFASDWIMVGLELLDEKLSSLEVSLVNAMNREYTLKMKQVLKQRDYEKLI